MIKTLTSVFIALVLSQSVAANEQTNERAKEETKPPLPPASEIQSLKPELKDAAVTFAKLSSGEVLALAEIGGATPDSDESNSNDESENPDTEFYVKTSATKPWVYLDRLKNGESAEFRNDGVIEVSISEGGTSRSSTTSLWRYEEGRLKVIGQDSDMVHSWALSTRSKETPFHSTVSTNYLAGKIVENSEFASGKKVKHACKFDPAIFRTLTFSDLNLGGLPEPSCPTEEVQKIDGRWKLIEGGCKSNDATEKGKEFFKAIQSGDISINLFVLSGRASYDGKLKDPKDPKWECSFHRTEDWSLKGSKLTVKNSSETYEGAPGDRKCVGYNSVDAPREHQLIFGKKMELQLGPMPTASVSKPVPVFCEKSSQRLIYERLPL